MSNDYVSFLQTEDYPAFCKELFRSSLFYSYNNKKRFLYAKTGVFNIIDIVLNETANIYVKNNRIPDALKIIIESWMDIYVEEYFKRRDISGEFADTSNSIYFDFGSIVCPHIILGYIKEKVQSFLSQSSLSESQKIFEQMIFDKKNTEKWKEFDSIFKKWFVSYSSAINMMNHKIKKRHMKNKDDSMEKYDSADANSYRTIEYLDNQQNSDSEKNGLQKFLEIDVGEAIKSLYGLNKNKESNSYLYDPNFFTKHFRMISYFISHEDELYFKSVAEVFFEQILDSEEKLDISDYCFSTRFLRTVIFFLHERQNENEKQIQEKENGILSTIRNNIGKSKFEKWIKNYSN